MVRNRGVVWTEPQQNVQEEVNKTLTQTISVHNCRRQTPADLSFVSLSPAVHTPLSALQVANARTSGCPFASGVCQCHSKEPMAHLDLPRLVVTGEAGHQARRLTDWLKSEVRQDLATRVQHHANALNCTPKRVSVRDQSTRWGSCSSTGTLSFSWRLIFAPAHVLDYVAAHEVAHLREMNHGPKFWRLVKQTMPHLHEARCWLKRWGAELHRFKAEG
jgi:hypothetical protein